MSVDTTPEQRDQGAPEASKRAPAAPPQAGPGLPQPWYQRLGLSFNNLNWRLTLLLSVAMAAGWCVLFLANNILQVLAGIVPVMAGLYLGRRVQGNYLAHGLVLGVSGFLVGMVLILVYGSIAASGILPMPVLQLQSGVPAAPATLGDLLFLYVTFSVFALIPFPAFGTVMAGRSEERNRQLREEIAERGGKLERPGVVRTLEDLRGLSLPQFGSFVASLYRKKGFTFKDYRFEKDKYLDLELEYNNERYLLRLSVADKVRLGTIESLIQDLRRREIPKGVVITSTEFAADTAKAVANKRNILTIDGQTLFDMADL